MSLKGFHIVFVTVSTLLFVFLALWAFVFTKEISTLTRCLGFTGIGGAVIMPIYGVFFYRKARENPPVTLSAMAMINQLACTICGYHSPDSPNNAAGYSIFFLLIVILLMLGGVVFCMARVMRRERENLDPALQDDYIRPTSTTP